MKYAALLFSSNQIGQDLWSLQSCSFSLMEKASNFGCAPFMSHSYIATIVQSDCRNAEPSVTVHNDRQQQWPWAKVEGLLYRPWAQLIDTCVLRARVNDIMSPDEICSRSTIPEMVEHLESATWDEYVGFLAFGLTQSPYHRVAAWDLHKVVLVD